MTQATCTRCGTTKPVAEFARDRSKKSGRTPHCKVCINAKSKRYYAEHREERLAYAKRAKVEREYKEPWTPLPDRSCDTCGEHYQPSRKDQRFCSRACQSARLRQRKRRYKRDIVVTCSFCRKPVLKPAAEAGRYERQYCDRACAGRAKKNAIGVDLVGPVASGIRRPVKDAPITRIFAARLCRCGEWVVALGSRAPRTCGCPDPQRVFVSGPCHECGEQFSSAMFPGATPPRFCSDPCWRRNRRRRDKQVRSKRIKSNARRETIDLPRLAKRDGWQCHICKRKVTRKNWSHDHLVPLSVGGSHTWDNVALAHALCNSIRGANGHAQLLLAA
jgi:5-methylcytosine-specific restriction endonuclease McrA